MTREEVVQIINEEMPTILVNQLTSQGLKENEVYLFNIEVGDTPREQVKHIVDNIREALLNVGLKKFVLVPMYKGKLKLKVKIIETTDLDNYEEVYF